MKTTQIYASSAPIATKAGVILGDKDKGSFGNRYDCAVAQIKNAANTAVKTTVAGVAVGAGTGVAMKSKGVNKLVQKGINALKETKLFKENAPQIKEIAQEGIEAFKKLPGSAKVIAGIGAAATLILGLNMERSHSFKAGQIDQEYTDKAQLQKTFEA